MERIDGGALPIYSWVRSLEPGALSQAINCANLPVAFHHVAIMADGHQGYGVPVGAVLALEGAISPYSVGNDIGCGMALVPTSVSRADLIAPQVTGSSAARDAIMRRIQREIPAGLGKDHRINRRDGEATSIAETGFAAMEEAVATFGRGAEGSTSTDGGRTRRKPIARSDFVAKAVSQAGTLGSGNHFIELLAGPEDDVWVMLHSGSRGVGGLICDSFHRMALAHCREEGHPLADPGLAWLPAEGDGERWGRIGLCYERALRAGLGYAELNRRRMLDSAGAIIEDTFPGSMQWDEMVNIHHNDATLEQHFGRSVWVHRKGAVKATEGTATITPGSMGTGSYLGRGLGNPLSFTSCAHGAGRAMSRGRARAELSLAAQLELVTKVGGKVFAESHEAVLDEMPAAYKDLDQVMADQADLVEPVKRLLPLATYKGADRPRRRRRGKARKAGWRPPEER
jgi:tRNA-splicing ligase RtcB (3'-phosphate/5'-hydroxy nucleic acid ligase)